MRGRKKRQREALQLGQERAGASMRPRIDTSRLRATLRLLFPGDRADQLAGLVDESPVSLEALARVIPAVSLRYTLARARRLAFRRSPPRGAPPLAPRPGLTTRGALALALHLGLDLNADTLADLFDTTPGRIGEELARARHALRPETTPGCLEHHTTLGRYHDPALEVSERLTLYRHVQNCERCRAARDAAEAVDRDLSAALDAARTSLPPEVGTLSRPARMLGSPSGLLISGIVLVLGLLAVGGLLGSQFLSSSQTPVPLVAAAAPPAAEGWLLFETEQGAEALDLATGAVIPLLVSDNPPLHGLDHASLSPGKTRLAIWSRYYDTAGVARIELRVTRLPDGQDATWSWEGGISTFPTGWLDDDTLLLATVPDWDPSQSDSENRDRMLREAKLLAFNVDTGETRDVVQAWFNVAPLSPDGTRLLGSNAHSESLELYSVTPDGLIEPLATIDRPIGYFGGIWAPDSSRFYVGTMAASDIEALQRNQGLDEGPRGEIIAIDRDGQVTTIIQGEPGDLLIPLGLSPDGTQFIYQVGREDTGTGHSLWSVWQSAPDGRDPRELRPGLRSLGQVLWNPDGTQMLFVGPDSSFLQDGDDPPRISFPNPVQWWSIELFDPVDRTTEMLARMAGLHHRAIAWLPPDALPPPKTPHPNPLRGVISGADRLRGIDPALTLGASAAVSDDGRFVLVEDRETGAIQAWDREAGTAQRFRFDLRDMTWVNRSSGLIGATSRRPSSIILAIRNGQGPTAEATRRLDPGNLREDEFRHYARPLLAPRNLAVSYVVNDEQAGNARLWIEASGSEPKLIASWSIPRSLAEDLPPLTIWVSPTTLLYAEPTGWKGGLPQEIRLNRAVISAPGKISVEPLVTLRASGGETGISLCEMALSPDGRYLALRLRHHTQRDPQVGAYDTVRILTSADLTQQFEIARGGNGVGLSWAHDSHWLAFGFRGRVALASRDGRSLEYVSAEGVSADTPLWIDAGELWFNAERDGEPGIMRVLVE